MLIQERRRPAWQAILLIAGFAASLWCARADAHEVPHHHEEAHEIPDTEHADGDIRGIRQLVRDFRRTGDDRYLDAAWNMVGNDLTGADPHMLVDAATVAQARHEFETALSLVDRALDIAPYNDQAWLLRASIQLVRGEIDQASRACRELQYSSLLVAMTCNARVAIARGDNEAALRNLTAVLAAPTVDASPEWRAWALSVAGDAAASIDADRAVSYYEQSLTLIESTQVRSALVDMLLAADRLADAKHVLEAGSHALPLDIRRMIVARRSGDESRGKQIAIADHEFRHWIADKDWLHAREMARFYLDVLDRPELARRLARINLTIQREREDLRLAERTGVLTTCAGC